MRRLHGEAGSRLGARWAMLEDGCNRNLTLALMSKILDGIVLI